MPAQNYIDQLQGRLQTHRETLAHYLRQRAMLSGVFEPPGVAAGIREARQEIARIKAILRTSQVPVEDNADDEPPATSPPGRVEQPDLAAGAVSAIAEANHRAGMPFVPSRPLLPPEPIFGRDSLIKQIAHSLRDGQSVNLVGAKAMGKTSLLNYLLAEHGPLCDTGIAWAWLNLDAIHDSGQFYAAASAGLLAALPDEQRRRPQIAALIAETRQIDIANAGFLRRVLAAITQLQPPHLPLLAVDNFENLLRPAAAPAFHFPVFFNDLREMRQGRGLLMLVASDERVERYCTERRDGMTSSFHDGLMVSQIAPLAPADAEALLLQTGRHTLTNAEIRAAAGWACGHPAHLQIAGVALYRARDESAGLDTAERYFRNQVAPGSPDQPAPGKIDTAIKWFRSLTGRGKN